jgi:hypothetical protein
MSYIVGIGHIMDRINTMFIHIQSYGYFSLQIPPIPPILRIGVILTPKASTFPHVPKYLKYHGGKRIEDT